MGYFKQLDISLRGELEDIEPPLSGLGELHHIVRTVLSITEVNEFDDYQLQLHGRRMGKTYVVMSSDGRVFATAGFEDKGNMTHLSNAKSISVESWVTVTDPIDVRNRVIAGTAFAFTTPRGDS